MKTKQIQQFLTKCLLPEFKGYAIARKILFATPLTTILRGFYFEDSEFNPESVYVWVFVMPLYVPKGYVYLTFGKRIFRKVGFLRTQQDWQIAAPYDDNLCATMIRVMRSQGVPYLSKLATPELLLRNLAFVTGLWGDPYVREAIAYSLARTGKLGSAKRRLSWLLRTVGREERYDELKTRGSKLLEAINRGSEATANLLDEWTKKTSQDLKLPVGPTE
jgi:hypothetical protein